MSAHYRRGFYEPGPNDPEYHAGGHRMPCGSLPRMVRMHPDHVPSTCVLFLKLPPKVPFGPARWRRVARTECSCGWAWGRTTGAGPGPLETGRKVLDRRGLDDVAVRGGHTTHTLFARREAA